MTKELSPYQRVMLALEGKQPDRVPVVLYPRYNALRYAQHTFAEALEDPEKYVVAQLSSQRRFQYDSVHDYNMMGPVEEAMGRPAGFKLKYVRDDAPMVETSAKIKTTTDLEKLNAKIDPHIDGLCPKVLWVVKQLKLRTMEKGEPTLPVITWGSCPSRTAAVLMGYDQWFMLLIKNPELATELMELCMGPWLDMVVAEVDSGADVVWVNDPVSSADCISRSHYEKYAQPYEKKFIAAIRERTGVPVIFHPCGNWHDRLDLVAQNGADAIFPGTMDLSLVYEKTMGVANVKALNGGVGSAKPNTKDVKGATLAEDATTLLSGKPDEVEREARRAIKVGTQRGAGFLLGGNCFPPQDVPPINIDAMVYSARKYGEYPISI